MFGLWNCVTGKVTSACRNASACAACGWLVDGPCSDRVECHRGRKRNADGSQDAGPPRRPQTSEKAETHGAPGSALNDTTFFFGTKMFSALPRSLLLVLVCAQVSQPADNNSKKTFISHFFSNNGLDAARKHSGGPILPSCSDYKSVKH